jgi:hypothetical protein
VAALPDAALYSCRVPARPLFHAMAFACKGLSAGIRSRRRRASASGLKTLPPAASRSAPVMLLLPSALAPART